jgi:hypothetical protein
MNVCHPLLADAVPLLEMSLPPLADTVPLFRMSLLPGGGPGGGGGGPARVPLAPDDAVPKRRGQAVEVRRKLLQILR